MCRASAGKHILSIILSVMVAFTFMPVFTQSAYAAAKTPAKVKIKSVTANANHVTVQWSKAKNAKKYKVFVQIGADGWKYWKSVKVTKKNKKKYSDKLKYRLKKSGKKYKVYKKKNPYKLVKTTTARKYTYTGKYSTTYRFVLQAVNGKKAGNYSAAKAVTTGAKPASPETPGNDPTGPGDPSDDPTAVPGKVQNVRTTVEGKTITVRWNSVSNATDYEVWYKTGDGEYISWKTTAKLGIKATERFDYSTKYTFKVRARNSNGNGEFSNEISCTTDKDPVTLVPGEFSSDPDVAYSQFEAKMLNYYNAELAKRGVSIDSTNKADEFQKLQAIIQVVHERMGLSEMLCNDYSNFPTGRCNWYYGNSYDNTNGHYYNGTDYCPTIEFYGSCDIVADIEAALANHAGLETRLLTDRGGHVFVIIQANYVWYDADAWVYMYPGCNGIDYGGCVNPSTMTEEPYDITYNLSIGIGHIVNGFSLDSVFYGTSNAITSDNGLLFGNVVGIRADQATYSSSDENVISFDNEAGTYTLHNSGVAYVTIVYKNIKPSGYQSQFPTYTTTISIKVLDQ